MILTDYQDHAINAIGELGVDSRRELAAAIDYTTTILMDSSETTREDLATFLDQLRYVIKEHGPTAHTTAWIPIVQYLAALHAAHPANDPDTNTILRQALDELYTDLRPTT